MNKISQDLSEWSGQTSCFVLKHCLLVLLKKAECMQVLCAYDIHTGNFGLNERMKIFRPNFNVKQSQLEH